MFSGRRGVVFWGALGAVLLLSRLAHRGILWSDEDYHLAAAIQVLHGKMLYRDVWYDKPPLTALLAVLFGGWYGWPLRVVGAAVAGLSCVMGFGVAREIWGEREGYWAAGLLGFFQIFYLPVAILPFEPDTLMIAAALGAVCLVLRGRFGWAGGVAGLAFLLSPKGLLVLVVCAVFLVKRPAGTGIPARAGEPALLLGFAVPCGVVGLWLAYGGALGDYVEQVWRWGFLYASTPGGDPQAQRGWLAVVDWMGFHAALVLAALWFFSRGREQRWRLGVWVVLALGSAALGGRFAPRYFDAVLAVLVIPAARGIVIMPHKRLTGALLALALAVPLVRFGPRYVMQSGWSDIAMDQESRRAGDWLLANAGGGDTVFVWGYRPNVVVYSRLAVASRWWDSQAVTGVPADRHLTDSRPVAAEWAAANRAELVRTRPTFIVDGLSAYNRALDIRGFGDLSEWLKGYCVVSVDGGITIYRGKSGVGSECK